MKNIVVSLICIFTLGMLACSKEVSYSNPAQQSLAGSWKFVSLTAHTSSTASYLDAGSQFTEVTLSDYVSTNNTGSMTFNGGVSTSTGIGYTVDTLAYGYSYENGVLTDSVNFPFTFTLPPTSSVSNYKLIGSDSMYFNSGSIATGPVSGVSNNPANNGVKFSLSGNQMIMHGSLFQTHVDSSQGFPIYVVDSARTTVILQKQ